MQFGKNKRSFHKELTPELKKGIRDVIIFYQRRLKSQKSLIGFCEFENREIIVEKNGKTQTKIIGCKVIPRSHPLFQEFKIWQTLNNIEVFVGERKRNASKRMFPPICLTIQRMSW